MGGVCVRVRVSVGVGVWGVCEYGCVSGTDGGSVSPSHRPGKDTGDRGPLNDERRV